MSTRLMVDCGQPRDACQHVGMHRSDDEPLGFLLYRVMAALRPQVAAELKPLGLGLPEFVCMRILAKHPGLTSAELARGTNVSAQAMNQVLHTLEDRGALTRPASTPVGRAMPAQLTRRGKALLKRADAAVQSADQRILTRLTADQQRHLKQLLYAAGTRPVEDRDACRNP
jgi:DNA-binding MarR family transcriptional regulator